MRLAVARFALLLTLGWLAAGCGSPTDPGTTAVVVEDARVSDCGGFPVPQTALTPRSEYCRAEVLRWQYTRETRELVLSDERVLLNCCGQHSVSLELDAGFYVMNELDEPGAAGRCLCLCVYDFSLTAQGVAEGLFPLRIRRVVTDDAQPASTVLETTLDLRAGSGSVVINESDVTPWCE